MDRRLLSDRFPRASAYSPGWLIAATSGGANPVWLTEWLTEAMDLRPGMRVLDPGLRAGGVLRRDRLDRLLRLLRHRRPLHRRGRPPADAMEDGWERWIDWQRGASPGNATEIAAIEADRGRTLAYVRAVARRTEAPLHPPITSIATEYAPAPLLREPARARPKEDA
jgi:hypothetical protein